MNDNETRQIELIDGTACPVRTRLIFICFELCKPAVEDGNK